VSDVEDMRDWSPITDMVLELPRCFFSPEVLVRATYSVPRFRVSLTLSSTGGCAEEDRGTESCGTVPLLLGDDNGADASLVVDTRVTIGTSPTPSWELCEKERSISDEEAVSVFVIMLLLEEEDDVVVFVVVLPVEDLNRDCGEKDGGDLDTKPSPSNPKVPIYRLGKSFSLE
jgi:hypothetical protein